MGVILVLRVHFREVVGSSPIAPTFPLPWSGALELFIHCRGAVLQDHDALEITDGDNILRI